MENPLPSSGLTPFNPAPGATSSGWCTGEFAATHQLPACPVCGGRLQDIRQKRQCERCHTICETCCEGGRG